MGWESNSTFQILIIPGTKGGLFVYNGAPAFGNLVASIAAQPGTDIFGNAYLAGFASYQPPIQAALNAAALAWSGGVSNASITYASGSGNLVLTTLSPAVVSVFGGGLSSQGLITASHGLSASGQVTFNSSETWLPPSGDNTGATDSAAIAAALAAFTDVNLLPGVFYTNRPIVMQANGSELHGSGGSIQSGNDASKGLGTTIKIVPGFTNTNPWAAQATGAIVLPQLNAGTGGGGPNPGANQTFGFRISDLWIDGTASPAGVDGVAALGSVNSIGIERVGVYHVTGRAFPMYTDPTWSGGAFPDGIYLNTCVAQTSGGEGFYGSYNDALLINCHAQSGAVDGFSFTSAPRLIGCRADLNVNGFTFDVPDGGGGFYSTVTLVDCGTQGNSSNGLNVINSSGSGTAPRAQVIAAGCDFDQDGAASISVSGRVALDLIGCACRTGNSFGFNPGGSPANSIAMATSGSSSGAPVVNATGCLFNAMTAILSGAASAGLLRITDSLGALGLGAAVSTYTPIPAASLTSHPAAPAGTVSVTLVMMGLGSSWAFTPAGTGVVKVDVTGFAFNPAVAMSFVVGCRFGTGAAPANGAAVTGTRFGSAGDPNLAAPATVGKSTGFAFTDVLTLTPGTAYWFDIALATDNAADQIHLSNIAFTAAELSQ